MKKYILLIALLIMSQTQLAKAEASFSELRVATSQLVEELNKVLYLDSSEKLVRLNQLNQEAEELFAKYQAQGASAHDQFEIQNCLVFVAEQQKALLAPESIDMEQAERDIVDYDITQS